ncbi:Translin-1 [Fusarium falciforme]
MSSDNPLLDPSIFAHLQEKIDEETRVRDNLTQIIQRLERAVATAQGLLSRVHSTPRARCQFFFALVLRLACDTLLRPTRPCACVPGRGCHQGGGHHRGGAERCCQPAPLLQVRLPGLPAEKHQNLTQLPRYNGKWARTVQNAIGTVVYTAWLGGLGSDSQPASLGRLLTLEQVGAVFQVPTNLKDRDAFHLTIEEYLLSLTDLTNELARLAPNAVTHGDFELPLVISGFIKDLFAGFQLLNLKNDILRKRADAVKYDVKRVEDVVYDLSLRGLVKRAGEGDTEMAAAE